MKKILLILGVLISFTNAYSQVGVNTESPLQLLHIDAKGNTLSTSESTKVDDVVVTSGGAVGVGKVNPASGLALDVSGNMNVSGSNFVEGNMTIEGNLSPASISIRTLNTSVKLQLAVENKDSVFRLADGSERAGHLLTCDTLTGDAYWQALRPMASTVTGKVNAGVPINTDSSPGIEVTAGNNLSLTPGKWMVFGKAVTSGTLGGYYMYLYLTKGTGAGRTVISQVGELAGSDGTGSYASPQLVYLLTVEDDEVYSLSMTTSYYTGSNSGTTRSTTGSYGGGYFYALRIDRANH